MELIISSTAQMYWTFLSGFIRLECGYRAAAETGQYSCDNIADHFQYGFPSLIHNGKFLEVKVPACRLRRQPKKLSLATLAEKLKTIALCLETPQIIFHF